MTAAQGIEPSREKALQDYRKKLLEHKDVEVRLKEGILSFYSYFGSLAIGTSTVLTFMLTSFS